MRGISMSDIVWSIEPGKGIGPLQLGASRADVIREIERVGLTVEDDPEEPQWLYVDEIDAELTFAEGPSPVLIEISCSDEQLRLGPIDLIDEPVIKIVELLKVSDDETVWTLPPDDKSDAANAAMAEGGETGVVASPSVEKLLKDGTLWIRPFGLGLELVLGDIFNVRLRRPGDIPPVEVGPLTAEQRVYAAHPELTSKLLDSMPSAGRPAEKSGLQCLGGIALIVALGIIVWRAVDLQQRWNSAPEVEAVVIGAHPPPPENFPDEYTVAYPDTQGARYEVVLKKWEVYGLPNIGDKLTVRYLPEAPHKPMTPAKFNDAGVSEYLPWGIGLFIGYFVLQFAVAVVGWGWRRSATQPGDEA
jgi:hypothetical protein